MRNLNLIAGFILCTSIAFAQTGHVMQGVGASNMSMGGASTGFTNDIAGAVQWNPAALTNFEGTIIRLDAGLFFSSPELSSSLPENMLGPGAPAVSGVTQDDRGTSIMPALTIMWRKPDSRHAFAFNAHGISGFGVTFPEETNNPLSASFNPTTNSNPINYPQQAMGFGRIESNYGLFQMGFSWAYQISEQFSIGVKPTFNYAMLELTPNPTAGPGAQGYPFVENTTATGFGGQIGLYYQANGLSFGASYKSTQYFSDFEFENIHGDGTTTESTFNMDYPAILSLGFGYTTGVFDFAGDYRLISYENTDGFSNTGWTNEAAVAGFGWEDISVISAGIQFRGIERLPLRLGYTYSSNPINSELAFFNAPATAIIKNAYQVGLGYGISDRVTVDLAYHHGTSSGSTSGQMMNPMLVSPQNPLGEIPGTSVSYSMTTDLVLMGINYQLK